MRLGFVISIALVFERFSDPMPTRFHQCLRAGDQVASSVRSLRISSLAAVTLFCPRVYSARLGGGFRLSSALSWSRRWFRTASPAAGCFRDRGLLLKADVYHTVYSAIDVAISATLPRRRGRRGRTLSRVSLFLLPSSPHLRILLASGARLLHA